MAANIVLTLLRIHCVLVRVDICTAPSSQADLIEITLFAYSKNLYLNQAHRVFYAEVCKFFQRCNNKKNFKKIWEANEKLMDAFLTRHRKSWIRSCGAIVLCWNDCAGYIHTCTQVVGSRFQGVHVSSKVWKI